MDAEVSIRPSLSKVTSNAKHEIEEEGPFEKTVLPEYLDGNTDPELKQVWNHPVYQADFQKLIVNKDKDILDLTLQNTFELVKEIEDLKRQKS